MSQKLNIILCASGHLPSGTSDAVFEAFYDTEVKPLISAMDKHHRINMMFHYSGVIFNWIENKHPEFFMLIEDLLSRKQVEFLGGGFYGPALTLLPLSDRIGQIEMLTTYLRKHFGKKPQGCWLPAMAWEQNLVGPLNSCGMNYTFLDYKQFSAAGVKPNAGGVFSPCITEDLGKLITVFPVASSIGRILCEGNPLEILGKLFKSFSFPQDEDDRTIVLPITGTDYEKLFEALSNANTGIRFTCAGKIIKNMQSLKKNYFPGVWASESYTENPKQFLADYPEAAGIYAKIIHVHTLINNQLRGDKTRKRTALEELWKAQDSGFFRLGTPSAPGIIHSPLRKAAYRSLIEAEKIIRDREKKTETPSLSVFDFNLDGKGEYIFQDDKLNCYIESLGACIFELDYLPCTWNYLDTMVLKSKRRRAFVDWLAPAGAVPEDFTPDGIKDGRFCGNEEYEVVDIDRLRRCVVFRLPPKSGFSWGEIEVGKTWMLKKNFLSLEYILKNTGTKSYNMIFSTSLDLSFAGDSDELLKIFKLSEGEKENITFNEFHTIRNAKAFEFHDLENEAVITIDLNRSFDARIFHVRSGHPGKEEYQSTCVMPYLKVSIEAGKSWKLGISLKIS